MAGAVLAAGACTASIGTAGLVASGVVLIIWLAPV